MQQKGEDWRKVDIILHIQILLLKKKKQQNFQDEFHIL